MGMTIEQKGAYMELLIFQFNNGPFTEAQAKQVLCICSASVWDTIQHKFKHESGRFFNTRLNDEILKRKAFSDSRRKNASHSKKQTKDEKQDVRAYAQHMEDENENRDSLVINTNTEDKLLKSEIWLENACLSLRLKNIEIGRGWVKKYILEMKAKETFAGRPISDLKHHFISWAKIELAKEAKLPAKTDAVYVKPAQKDNQDADFIKKFYSEKNTGPNQQKPGGIGDLVKKQLGQ